MRLFIIFFIFTLILPGFGVAGQPKSEDLSVTTQGTAQAKDGRKITGSPKVIFKEECVQDITNYVFLTKSDINDCPDEVKEAIEEFFKSQTNIPVIWIRLTLNLSTLSKFLQKKEPSLQSFSKKDFGGILGKNKIIPIAPEGTVSVVDGEIRSLEQNLIFRVPLSARDLQVTIRNRSLVKLAF